MRANRYVSYLATEIEPKALSTLSQFERATERAFERIAAFNDRGASRLGTSLANGFGPSTRQAITGTSTALQGVKRDADRTQQSLGRAAAEANVMSTAFFRSAQALNVVQGPLGPLAGRLSSLGYIFRDLAGISLAGVLGGGGAFAIGSIASSYQRVTDRLRPFYDTQVQTNAAMRDVIQIARDTRQALDPVAQLYSRLAVAGKANNVGADTARLTETVAKAARLSGGDANAQEAGLTQFAQGFGSGTLGGDELRSIRENTFRLAKAIADGLDVPIAKLKQLGADGKLTPQVIAAALANSADQIDLEFSRLPKRIGQSLTEAQNNLAIFLGQLDETTGATTGFAKAISFAGNNIPILITGVAGLSAVFAARSLASPIAAATSALERFGKMQAFVSQAARGRQVSSGVLARYGASDAIVKARQAQEAARARMDSALGDQRAADAGVRAGRADVFAANARLAAAKEAAAAALAEQRAIEQGAREGVVLAQARVSAAQQELALAQEAGAVRRASDIEAARARLNIARADVNAARSAQAGASQRLVAANQAVDTAGASGGSRADRARAAATAVRQQAVAEAELTGAQNATAAATARLTAAEAELTAVRAAQRVPTAAAVAGAVELAAAEEALAIATNNASTATAINSTTANANAKRGFALLGLAEARIAAETGLAAATTRSAAANTAAGIATGAYTAAQTAFNVAAGLGARAMATLTAAGRGLSALLGGPLGIALTAATIGFTYLATRTDEALEAFDRFKTAQDELQQKLGGTADALANVSAQARQARIDIAQLAVDSAKEKKAGAAKSLASSLDDAALSIPFSKGSIVGADGQRLRDIAARLRGGQTAGISYTDFRKIVDRNPEAFAKSGIPGVDAFQGLVGSRPRDSISKALGYMQTGTEVADAERTLAEARAAKPKPRQATGLGGPRPRTNAELEADAALYSSGGTAAVQARRQFNDTKAKLDAQRDQDRKDGKFDAAAEQAYVVALGNAQKKLDAVGDSQRAAAAGAREHRAAIVAQNKDLREAEANASALAKIQGRYQQEDSNPQKRADQDKRAVDDLFVRIRDGKAEVRDTIQLLNNETGKLEPFTRADAEEVKRNIDDYVRKPITDTIRDQGRELEIARLILAGRGNEAELLRQKYDLQQRSTTLTEEDLAALRRNQAEQQRINDAIAQRQRLIDNQAKAYGTLVGAVQDFIANPLDIGKTITGVIQQFRQQMAERITLKLFGDPEQDFRDKMTRGLNDSASRLTTSADRLDSAATAMTDAAGAVRGSAGGSSGSSIPGAVSGLAPQLSVDIDSLMKDAGVTLGGVLQEESEDIVVTAKRKIQEGRDKGLSTEKIYNNVGKELSTKVFGANSVITRALSKVGTFISGAGTGLAAQSVLGTGGRSKEASIGAAIGGGLGKTLLGGENGLFAKGLTAISSKLGGFAGPLGSIAGSVVGSVIGGLLTKTKKASATITSVGGDATVTGNSGAYKTAALGSAGSVQSGIGKIADALGGSTGSFAVSIGSRKKKYVVDPTGGGRTKGSGTLSFDTEEEAINAAILNAIQDGAVKGIRAGAQRLLAAGRDLDKQLQKAVSFQNVFRELKQYTDPVGAAIDDLNVQFEHLIDVFNEAGASTSEFQDLQKLYDLKRADAIKNATNGTVDKLQEFINGLKGGSDSPLGRRTVYDNAKAQVDTYRADLAAGKTVDSDKLLDALGKYQDASRTLNGSRGEFFTDFNDILALAEKAKSNVEAGQASGGALPASPFADPAVQEKLGVTAQNTGDMLDVLYDIRGALQSGGGSGADGSSLSYLPSKFYDGGSYYDGGGLYNQNVALY